MSIPIVVDEWLFEDLAGRNGPEKENQAISFLLKLEEICDRIVVLEGSPFEKKMHELMKSNDGSPRFRTARSVFMNLIATNNLKKYNLRKDDVTMLPQAFINLINDPPDHYLFQCYEKLKNKNSFILTSDNKWKEDKLRKSGVRIEKRDAFIKTYLERRKIIN